MQARLWRSEGFRMAAFYAALFVGAFAILMVAIYSITDSTLREHYEDEVNEDISAITDGFREKGVSEAIELIGQHTVDTDGNDYYLLQDRSGKKLAGNLPPQAEKLGMRDIRPPPRMPGASDQPIRGRGLLLSDGLYLFVGTDTEPVVETRERILDAFFLVAGPTLLLVMAAGFLFNRSFLRRIDAITHTCQAIMAGRFGERVQTDGSHSEVARLSQTVNSMLDRISSLMENLREVSSAVAHDLRTPLTRLRQKLEQAKVTAHTPQQFQETIDQTIANTDEILAIFSSLLSLSRIESGARAASFASVSLPALLTDVMHIYAPLAADQGKQIETDFPAAAAVQGDRMLLMQLFSNLMENAIHHTPAGTRIRLTLGHENGATLADVSDNGPGMAAEDRDKAFRRFWRGDASRGKPGHGLGLSIVGAIAALHGAQISLADAGPGLKVTVAFPTG